MRRNAAIVCLLLISLVVACGRKAGSESDIKKRLGHSPHTPDTSVQATISAVAPPESGARKDTTMMATQAFAAANYDETTNLLAISTTPGPTVVYKESTVRALSLAAFLLTNHSMAAQEKLSMVDAYSLGIITNNIYPETNVYFFLFGCYWPYASRAMLYNLLKDIAEDTSNGDGDRADAYLRMCGIADTFYRGADVVELGKKAASLYQSVHNNNDAAFAYWYVGLAYAELMNDEERSVDYLRQASAISSAGHLQESINSALVVSLLYEARNDEASLVINQLTEKHKTAYLV